MKKILITNLIAVFSFVSNAQNTRELVSPNNDTTPVIEQSQSVEERLKSQEQELKALKKDNQELKLQMKQLRSPFFKTNRKVAVSRIGSKQIITE